MYLLTTHVLLTYSITRLPCVQAVELHGLGKWAAVQRQAKLVGRTDQHCKVRHAHVACACRMHMHMHMHARSAGCGTQAMADDPLVITPHSLT